MIAKGVDQSEGRLLVRALPPRTDADKAIKLSTSPLCHKSRSRFALANSQPRQGPRWGGSVSKSQAVSGHFVLLLAVSSVAYTPLKNRVAANSSTKPISAKKLGLVTRRRKGRRRQGLQKKKKYTSSMALTNTSLDQERQKVCFSILNLP